MIGWARRGFKGAAEHRQAYQLNQNAYRNCMFASGHILLIRYMLRRRMGFGISVLLLLNLKTRPLDRKCSAIKCSSVNMVTQTWNLDFLHEEIETGFATVGKHISVKPRFLPLIGLLIAVRG